MESKKSAKNQKYKGQKQKLNKAQPKVNVKPVKPRGTKNQEHTTRRHWETWEQAQVNITRLQGAYRLYTHDII